VATVIPGVGDTLAGYTVERLLGRGGMGAVYLATHDRLRRRAALKVLVPELAEDQTFRERFIRESELAASLDHPNVVPIYDADEQDGVLFIAMKYVDGSDLKQVLREHTRLSVERTLEIVGQVAGALDAAHAAALVHRDVKPANVLIEEPSGKVYLSDFGVAKRTTSAGPTMPGSFLGSVDYCPPEQIHGRPLDGRADVYALGAVAFHCLAGQPPFPKETDVAVIQAHLADPVPALSTVQPGLSRALDGVIATAMAKYPEVRYGSAGEFADALAAAARSTDETTAAPVGAPTIASSARAATVLDESGETAVPPGQPVKRRRRKPWLWIAGLAAVALAGIAVAVVVLGGGSDNPTTTEAATSQTTPTTTAPVTPPPPAVVPVVTQMSNRLEAKVIPRQQAVNERVELARATSASLGAIKRSADALEREALRTQGWLTTLHPGSAADRAAVRSLDSALAAQATYARALTDLPGNPSALTKEAVQRVLTAAGNAESAYVRLSGAAPSLPTMPLSKADHEGLLLLVPKPKPKVTQQPVAPPPPPPPPPVSTTNDQEQIAQTIHGHWQAVNNGNYEYAFSFFSPKLQSQAGRANWLDDKYRDRPTSSEISVQSVSVSGDYATAYVNFTTRGQETGAGNTGCNAWSGSYSMARVSGRWLIDHSNLVRTGLSC
jgi:serine/threonine protein kinase